MQLRRTFLVLLILAAFCGSAFAQQKLLTLDDLYDPAARVNFSGSTVSVRWLRDGVHYLQTRSTGGGPAGRGARGSAGGQAMKVNAATGESAPFLDTARMEGALAKLPGVSAEDARRLSRRGTYRMNSAETALLLNYANDLFYYEPDSGRALRLTNDPAEETGEEFSPDSTMVSFVRGNNLYVVELGSQRERALTTDGAAKILNGRLDWVYQEELYGRGDFKAYWWNPDSSRIAYLRLDENPVNQFTVIDHIPHLQQVETTPYPKAGDPNPGVQLGVVPAAGGATKWMDDFAYRAVEPLIVRVCWTPDGKNVVYQVQNREQTWLHLNFASPETGQYKTVLKETSKTWVEVIDNPKWMKDGSFLWQSERSGYRHVYHYAADGKLLRPITEGRWEVRQLYGVDEANGWVYFSASEHSPIANHVYRVKLDGSGLARLSREEGSHTASFSPNFSYFTDQWSDINTPTQARLYNADGSLVRVIEENKVEALKQYMLGKPEFLQVKTRDGFTMEAMMIKPPGFDAKKKYPVMSFTYSGPHAQSVRNAWGGTTLMWYHLLAQKGYLIWVCDNRTSSAKGVEPAWLGYKRLGELELRDLEDGLAWLRNQPYVDGGRIGLHGWSYGGFMTSYALTHSTSFKAGIAGGSVTDWRLYDSIYTERYMALPQNNPEGYAATAPVHAAKNLHGKLLLIHGSMDDNVHMQNTLQFVYELQKAGKQFQLQLYPKSRHGVADPALVKHMRTLMTDFILENL